MAEDRVIPASSRARWGFSGTKDKIEVATTESGRAGLYEKGKAKPSESEGAVHNGGGEEKPKRASKKKSEDTDTES